nr:uncharacterized protein LOC108121417 isoform X1 [Drosophila bipectinata]
MFRPLAVMPMNGQPGGQNGRKRRDNDDFSVKLSTIRIWMHEKDIGKLTRILWAGQGNRLCQQASNNGRVKRFLAAVPHVMNAIKDLHQAVIDNNLESVQSQLEPPVPSALVTCKDGNGLNIIHKAAGLGHTKILEYLVGIWAEGAHEVDITGKTALHWAASAKNNMRCYTLLTQAGCDEEAVDYKMKTPSYYRHKPHEIERAFLVYVPEAPRVSPESVTDWEALGDDTGGDNGAGGDSKKLEMKVLLAPGHHKWLDDSLENTSELDTNDGTSANEDDDLSKADAEPVPEADVAASPLQRRPETPATFNTINGDDSEAEDTRIKGIVESGDLEQLAEIVLNGEGGRLMGLTSPEPEIQAFLNNVPTYMEKIHRVHDAARDGGLLALQQALDRRKFAIAKDDISPNGSTPLHVAVLFGHTDIVRYLASRFPETMTITDNDGRTPLHYAATIKDNGHFYHMLLQMGANPKSLDKLGHSAEFYLDRDKAKNILNYTELLNIFGAEELENQLLTDQVPDDLHSARRELQDGEISRTLERCYSVISESGKLLSGTTASALSHRKPLSASSLQLSVTSYLSRFLKRPVYEKIKRRQTRLDHNLFDILWPAMRKTSKARHLEEDINCGIIAPDFDVFVVFQEFLVPLLKDMHCLSIDNDFKPQPRLAYFPMDNGERLNTAAFVFDDESMLVTRCLVEASRNLDQLELPLNLTIGQLEQAERLMMSKIFTTNFADAIGETDSGNYFTLTELLEPDSEVAMMLNSLGLMIPLLDTQDLVQAAESTAFNGALWPYGRGVFVNSAHNLAVWLNCQEHLRVISITGGKEPADMGAAYTRVGRAISYLETQLHFKESYLLGYLQSRPSYLGTGLKMTTIVKLPNLMKEMDNLRHLCSVRGLSMVTNRLSKLTVRLVNMQSMGVVEYVLFQDYCTAVTNILSLEKDMSLTNSKHIATMLVKIFRRKKNSIVDRN